MFDARSGAVGGRGEGALDALSIGGLVTSYQLHNLDFEAHGSLHKGKEWIA